ncbi:MAG: cytochrome c, class I [Burkholderiales bacterium]|nr:cytochrome c, class I [Burkholderiales bacterium]MDE2275394.1 cytochrome c, class I [Burkholderiales bacterium]
MNRQQLVSVAWALAALGSAGPAPALTKRYQAPPDTVMLTPSEMPGYAKAQANCTSCHSAEYMRYQPPNAGRPYWDAMVHRMKTVFNAPIDDADMPAIVDYLSATYGNKNGK